MADDIRQLLHGAAPSHELPADFDRVWNRARRQRRSSQLGAAVAGIVVLAASAVVIGQLLPTTPTVEVTSTPNGCPVTIPDGGFVPPAPYPVQPTSDGDVWYGTSELWTVLDGDGDYRPRKSVWWSEHFAGGHREPEPEITVTWERLDAPDAPTVTVDEGTNAHTIDDGWFHDRRPRPCDARLLAGHGQLRGCRPLLHLPRGTLRVAGSSVAARPPRLALAARRSPSGRVPTRARRTAHQHLSPDGTHRATADRVAGQNRVSPCALD